MKKPIVFVLTVLLLLPLMTISVAPSTASILQLGTLPLRPPGVGKGGETDELSVSIAFPEDGAILKVGTYSIDVKVSGRRISSVSVIIDSEIHDITESQSVLNDEYRVFYPWIPEEARGYTITAEVTDKRGNTASTSIQVTIVESVPDPTYELFIEIDYMVGHEPTQDVLDYISDYYYARGIEVTFEIDDVVADPTSGDGVTIEDFWLIEGEWNDGDDATGSDSYYVTTSKDKWVLYGTTDETYGAIGYLAITDGYLEYNPRNMKIVNVEVLAGNYIFIADATADGWATTNGIDPSGAEAAVVMHELGHSIGIVKVGWEGDLRKGYDLYEIYDADSFSVMSYLTTDNAGLDDAWHYSNDYWELKNVEGYYEKP